MNTTPTQAQATDAVEQAFRDCYEKRSRNPMDAAANMRRAFDAGLASQAPTQPSGGAGAGAVLTDDTIERLRFEAADYGVVNRNAAHKLARAVEAKVREQAALPGVSGARRVLDADGRSVRVRDQDVAEAPADARYLLALLSRTTWADEEARADSEWQAGASCERVSRICKALLATQVIHLDLCASQDDTMAAYPNCDCGALAQGTSQAAAPTESQLDAMQELADLGQEMGEYGEVAPTENTCKLTECQSQPRCRYCLAMDERHANGGKTGSPPGLLQDDCRGLSKWLSSRPDALRRVREACIEIEAQHRAILAEAGITQEKTNG